LTGQLEVDANSAHHQAVKDVPDALRVTGRSADGLIEVLEPENKSIPLVAVQWHPESETNDVIGLDLFKWLVSESRK
jgi:putative glutamine amidotransferase